MRPGCWPAGPGCACATSTGPRLREPAALPRRRAMGTAQRCRHREGALAGVPREGHPLLSDQGRVLATMVADTSGHHDALCGHRGAGHPPSSTRRRQAGPRTPRPGPVARCSTAPGSGRTAPGHRKCEAGATLELIVHLPVMLSLINTPHPLDPDRTPTGPRAARLARGRSATAPATTTPNTGGPCSTPKTPGPQHRPGRAEMTTTNRPSSSTRSSPRARRGRRSSAPARRADRRPARQPGRRLPALRRGRPRHALQRAGHRRRAAQHLPDAPAPCCGPTTARR